MNTFTSWDSELYHHGIKGQKWGIRRFQNPDGTLTEAGKQRYYRNGKYDFYQFRFDINEKNPLSTSSRAARSILKSEILKSKDIRQKVSGLSKERTAKTREAERAVDLFLRNMFNVKYERESQFNGTTQMAKRIIEDISRENRKAAINNEKQQKKLANNLEKKDKKALAKVADKLSEDPIYNDLQKKLKSVEKLEGEFARNAMLQKRYGYDSTKYGEREQLEGYRSFLNAEKDYFKSKGFTNFDKEIGDSRRAFVDYAEKRVGDILGKYGQKEVRSVFGGDETLAKNVSRRVYLDIESNIINSLNEKYKDL